MGSKSIKICIWLNVNHLSWTKMHSWYLGIKHSWNHIHIRETGPLPSLAGTGIFRPTIVFVGSVRLFWSPQTKHFSQLKPLIDASNRCDLSRARITAGNKDYCWFFVPFRALMGQPFLSRMGVGTIYSFGLQGQISEWGIAICLLNLYNNVICGSLYVLVCFPSTSAVCLYLPVSFFTMYYNQSILDKYTSI